MAGKNALSNDEDKSSTIPKQIDGLEFSDPLSSHIVQACARIAGIIGDDYKPYVDLYIPPLLTSISKGISVQVAKEGDFFQPQGPGGQGNGEKEPDVFNVYQRGIGNVQVIFNTHEITEREMGCRCLYQYITDIHQSLWHQSLPIVKAVCPLLSSTVHKSEDLFVTTGAIVVDALKMFLFYSPSSYLTPPYTASLLPSTPPHTSSSSSPPVSAPPYTVSCAGEMACIEAVREIMMTSLSHLHKALQQLQYCCASTSTNTSTDLKLAIAIAGTINELLNAKLNSTLSISHSNKWPHCIPSDVMFELMITVRDMSVLFIQKRYIDIIPTSDEDEESESELSILLSSIITTFLKLFREEAKAFVLSEIMPFVQGFLGNLENPDFLDSYPITVLCAVMENIPSYSEECSSLLAPYLLHYIRKETAMVDCIDGFAACAVYGGPCFDKYCGPAVTILLQLNDVRNAPDDLVSPDNNLNCTEVELHACAALFRISVYREHALQGTAAKMLEMCFVSLPFTLYCDQAKVEHKLFIDLLEHKDIRLLGPTGRVENLAQVLNTLSVLVEILYHEEEDSRIENTINFIKDEYDTEFWERELVDVHTLLMARKVLKNAFAPGGLPSQILQPVLKKLDKCAKTNLLKYSK